MLLGCRPWRAAVPPELRTWRGGDARERGQTLQPFRACTLGWRNPGKWFVCSRGYLLGWHIHITSPSHAMARRLKSDAASRKRSAADAAMRETYCFMVLRCSPGCKQLPAQRRAHGARAKAPRVQHMCSVCQHSWAQSWAPHGRCAPLHAGKHGMPAARRELACRFALESACAVLDMKGKSKIQVRSGAFPKCVRFCCALAPCAHNAPTAANAEVVLMCLSIRLGADAYAFGAGALSLRGATWRAPTILCCFFSAPRSGIAAGMRPWNPSRTASIRSSTP